MASKSHNSGHTPPERDRAALRGRKSFNKWAKEQRQSLVDWIGWRWPKCDAEAIVNEALKEVWARRKELRRNPSLKLLAYTRTVLWRAARSESKRGVRQRSLGDEWLLQLQSADRLPDEEAAFRETLERLRQAVSKFQPRDRELLRLCYEEQLPWAEIAERMGAPEGTVKAREHRIRKKLRKALGGTGA